MSLNVVQLTADIKAAFAAAAASPGVGAQDIIAGLLAAAIMKQLTQAVVAGTATGALGGGPGVPIVGTLT